MSLYEALVLVAMVGVGGFAWHVYRKDTRSGAPEPPAEAGSPMFGRAPKSRSGDDAKS
jgi:hypothetical protein